MNIRRSRTRRTGVGLLVIAVAARGACSSETKRSIDDASTTVAGPSTTVLADVTTTLAATTTVPVEATTIPVVTDAPTTIPAPQPTDPPATDAPGFGLYDEVSPPGVPSGHTDPFASSGVLGNGVYWVQYNGGETFTPDIEVTQAFFGAECETQAAAAGDECLNDIFQHAEELLEHARRAALGASLQPQRSGARRLRLRLVPVEDDVAGRHDREVRAGVGAVAPSP